MQVEDCTRAIFVAITGSRTKQKGGSSLAVAEPAKEVCYHLHSLSVHSWNWYADFSYSAT
jgi:hypothetical protein